MKNESVSSVFSLHVYHLIVDRLSSISTVAFSYSTCSFLLNCHADDIVLALPLLLIPFSFSAQCLVFSVLGLSAHSELRSFVAQCLLLSAHSVFETPFLVLIQYINVHIQYALFFLIVYRSPPHVRTSCSNCELHVSLTRCYSCSHKN